MSQTKKTAPITVRDTLFTIISVDQNDHISLTDMARVRTDAGRVANAIKNRLRTRSTHECLGTWEVMYNLEFKVVEFDHFRCEAGLHTFTLSAKEWTKNRYHFMPPKSHSRRRSGYVKFSAAQE